jgi:hypothetical protein
MLTLLRIHLIAWHHFLMAGDLSTMRGLLVILTLSQHIFHVKALEKET